MAERIKDIQLLRGTEKDAEKEGEDSPTVRERERERERMLTVYKLNIIRPSALYIFQDASVLCMPFAELGERVRKEVRVREKEREGERGGVQMRRRMMRSWWEGE
jgi:hypothetical protein